ncbi:hypothetical protein AB0L88_01365 [Saccharopolyspora shandongensis]|uniref:hypothetical protein n=1 Tax=Saccharopolyspora shandongensis TaxID=418495 RepID=UPI003441162D
MNTDRFDEIKARRDAATPGEWHWAGNLDNGDPYLATWTPGLGRCVVMGHLRVERRADDPRLQGIHEFADEQEARAIRRDFLRDRYNEPRTDDRLCFTDGDPPLRTLVPARDQAVFEVAPNATSRKDPAVYRADIAGIRNPDARFIEHSRGDVDWLIGEVERLRNLLFDTENREVA